MKKVVTTSIAALGITAMLGFSTAEAATNYTVQNGDSYWKIGQKFGVSYDSVMKLNGADSTLIFPGDVLHIPEKGAQVPVATKVASTTTSTPSVSQSSLDLLARLVEAEAGAESYSGKLAVAKVVLNRVVSNEFPNTIREVIYQSGQFSPVGNGMINNPAEPDSIQAAKDAINIGGNANGALYFYNPATSTQAGWLSTLPTVEVIGHHIFKK